MRGMEGGGREEWRQEAGGGSQETNGSLKKIGATVPSAPNSYFIIHTSYFIFDPLLTALIAFHHILYKSHPANTFFNGREFHHISVY